MYRKQCHTSLRWDEVGERKLIDSEYLCITVENVKVIRDRMKIAQDRQKSYVDKKINDLEFNVGD